jgi:DnaJ-class molecular chaperone
MASDDTEPPADVPCSACRGTGRVISNLGGTPHEVACPWCEGGGRRLPAHNAQAKGGGEGGGNGGDGDDRPPGGGGGPDLAA